MVQIKRRIKAYLGLIQCKINPVKYARSLGVKVGENVKFYSPDAHMFSTEPWLITIGNNVHITSNVQFLTHDGGTLILQDKVPNFVVTGDIVVGDNTYIGIRTIVLPGVKIGKGCIIGCGSVVTKDIPDNSVAAGVPARVISTTDKYVGKLESIIAGENPRYYKDLADMHSLREQRIKENNI